MKQATKEVYKMDLIIQSFILIPGLLCYLGAFINYELLSIGLMAQLVLGITQLGGLLFHAIRYKNEQKITFFKEVVRILITFIFINIIFLFFGYVGFALIALALILLFIVQGVVSLLYYNYTLKSYKEETHYDVPINEDVLDDLMTL